MLPLSCLLGATYCPFTVRLLKLTTVPLLRYLRHHLLGLCRHLTVCLLPLFPGPLPQPPYDSVKESLKEATGIELPDSPEVPTLPELPDPYQAGTYLPVETSEADESNE